MSRSSVGTCWFHQRFQAMQLNWFNQVNILPFDFVMGLIEVNHSEYIVLQKHQNL